MKALITGGSGFIGRNIATLLESKGWDIRIIDTEKPSMDFDFVSGSVTDPDILNKAMNGVDVVFHEAAVTSPPQFEETPLPGFSVNVNGTMNVMECALKNSVKRVVLASSSAIYGNTQKIVSESDTDNSFISVYPMTKYIDEIIASYYSNNTDLETVALRYFNTFGPGENTKGYYSSVIHKFIDNIEKHEKPVIFGDGKQSRDFIYVKDVANANLLAATKGVSGSAYNIGTGKTNSFNHILRVVCECMGRQVEPRYEPIPFKSYQMFTQANISKARQELGFEPQYDLKGGILETIRELTSDS